LLFFFKKEERIFFFEKKQQKTFNFWALPGYTEAPCCAIHCSSDVRG